jgi:hypothetical protein
MELPTQAAALLASGLILPILDGLDEIPEMVRGPAVSRINAALRPGEHVVVTCRSQQYRDAVKPKGGIETTLRAAAAVQVCPLDADAVRRYLCDDAAGAIAKDRWETVFAVLGTKSPTGQALETPLMVSLTRAIYNPRPGELAGVLRDPAELCNPDLADRTSVESFLFDAFIPSAYRPDLAGRWNAQDVEKWLVFLAGNLEHRVGGLPDLEMWQLPLAVPAFPLITSAVTGVVAGTVAGIVVGAVAGIMAGIVAGVTVGTGTGVATIFMTWLVTLPSTMPEVMKEEVPVTEARVGIARVWYSLRPVAAMTAGFEILVVVFLVFWIMPNHDTVITAGEVWAGMAAAAVAWYALMAQVGFLASSYIKSAVSPADVLARDRHEAVFRGSAAAAGAGVAAGVVASVFAGDRVGVAAGVVAGAVAVCGASIFSEWSRYGIARTWLALCHRLPWPLMSFLADAHGRGILRQAGAVYQFRHIELQHRLATPPTNSAGTLRGLTPRQ